MKLDDVHACRRPSGDQQEELLVNGDGYRRPGQVYATSDEERNEVGKIIEEHS